MRTGNLTGCFRARSALARQELAGGLLNVSRPNRNGVMREGPCRLVVASRSSAGMPESN